MRRTATLLLGSLLLSFSALVACSSDDEAPQGSSSSSGDDGTSSSSSSGAPEDAGGDATVSSSSSSGSSSGDAAVLPVDAGEDAGPDAGPYPGIHFIGRFDFRDPAGPKFEWSGTSIVARFHGTGIAIRLAEVLEPDGNGAHQQLRVTLDGTTTSLLILNDAPAYTLATGLPDGEHTVEITKRTEALFGTVQFLGFDVEGGEVIASEYPFTRKLEFLGDSITAGYGNEGAAPCSFSAPTENGTVAYGAVTAHALEAAYQAVAWSGRGLRVNYGDAQLPTMPVLYGLSRPWDPTSEWDFTSYVPDVVVIHLGTNDTWSQPDPGEAFTTDYVTLLVRMRNLYPAAHLFVVAAPERAGVVTRASAAVQQRNDANDAAVHFMAFDSYDQQRDGVGCDGHPSAAAHQVMATKLTAAIRAVMAW